MSSGAAKGASPAPAHSAFHKKRTEEAPRPVVIDEQGAAAAPPARKPEPGPRRDMPALLRQIAETTRDALREEAVQGHCEERHYIRRYIDQQMNAYFREQLQQLKLQLSAFIRDFLEVKNTELVSMSMSRESLRAEQELREMQSVVDGLRQSVSRLVGREHGNSPRPPAAGPGSADAQVAARLAENDRAIAEAAAQNAALGKLLAAQQEQLAELRGSLGGITEAEMNGLFGDEVNFSIIKKQRDDTLAEEWLPAEMRLGRADASPRYLSTSLAARPAVVSFAAASPPPAPNPYLARHNQEEHQRPSALPLHVGRERLQQFLPHLKWGQIPESAFIVDANRIITDADANPIIDENGNLIKMSDDVLEALRDGMP